MVIVIISFVIIKSWLENKKVEKKESDSNINKYRQSIPNS